MLSSILVSKNVQNAVCRYVDRCISFAIKLVVGSCSNLFKKKTSEKIAELTNSQGFFQMHLTTNLKSFFSCRISQICLHLFRDVKLRFRVYVDTGRAANITYKKYKVLNKSFLHMFSWLQQHSLLNVFLCFFFKGLYLKIYQLLLTMF